MPLSVIIGGPISVAGAPTSGTAQVETAVIVGTITLAGNAKLTVTSALVQGSPLDVLVAVALDDTATQVAAKMATKLNATAAVAAHYVASSTDANLKLTAIKSAANDGTLNVAYTNDDCTGLTPDASSDNTTGGVVGDWRGAEEGTILLDTTNKIIYRNTGSTYVPKWTAV